MPSTPKNPDANLFHRILEKWVLFLIQTHDGVLQKGQFLTQFVPMHRAISKKWVDEELLMALVGKNWSRSIIWTLVFLWGVLNSIR